MNVMLLGAILDKNEPLKPVDALLLAVIGIVIVFVVLILLMLIVSLVGKIFDKSDKLKENHPEWNQKIQSARAKLQFWKKKNDDNADTQTVGAEVAEHKLADGTCGELKLVNVEERDAAMIMAIVADELDTPLNELRFKSIKRVEEEK